MNHSNHLARVCVSYGERARVVYNQTECDALVAGALLYGGDTLPVTGDWVRVRPVEPELVLIEEILPRRSRIARRAAGRRADEQVLAANVDVALLVCGLDGNFNIRRIERYLAICQEGGVEPVVVLNKADLYDSAGALAQTRAITRTVLAISARTGVGCEAITALLGSEVTAVLLGSSGAGKSSLLNRLLGQPVQATRPVRASDSRGRHTTTARELIPLPSGAALIDTPGLREIQLLVSEESLEVVFSEIAELAGRCRYRDCSHDREPGCAVRAAVPPERLASFHKLQREAARHTSEANSKDRWRAVHKAMRRFYRERGR